MRCPQTNMEPGKRPFKDICPSRVRQVRVPLSLNKAGFPASLGRVPVL